VRALADAHGGRGCVSRAALAGLMDWRWADGLGLAAVLATSHHGRWRTHLVEGADVAGTSCLKSASPDFHSLYALRLPEG